MPRANHHYPQELNPQDWTFDDVEVVQTDGRCIYVENLATGERARLAPAELGRAYYDY